MVSSSIFCDCLTFQLSLTRLATRQGYLRVPAVRPAVALPPGPLPLGFLSLLRGAPVPVCEQGRWVEVGHGQCHTAEGGVLLCLLVSQALGGRWTWSVSHCRVRGAPVPVCEPGVGWKSDMVSVMLPRAGLAFPPTGRAALCFGGRRPVCRSAWPL